MVRLRRARPLGMAFRGSLGALILLLASCSGDESEPLPSATKSLTDPGKVAVEAPAAGVGADAQYVTSAACQGCHPSEVEAWTGSHHDRAMERATAETVLGDFDDALFEKQGVAWRFFRRDEAFIVNTVGPDGARADFEILHTFGVDPLQQYLVALPGGRMQALTVAWDSRAKTDGGQRWFSLHPDEATQPGDVLHWTGIANRWNSMCAHCHSTNVRKNFDLAEASYDTRWSEIDVACEACHGPASLHVDWASSGADPSSSGRGFANRLGAGAEARWVMNPETGIAFRDPARTDEAEIDACSGCHSRRSLISEAGAEQRFLDRHIPSLLEEGLYFADGQIQDEVYVYGSFMQSRMYHAGVRCGDCHEPHSPALRASGNALCGQCHAPSVFAGRSHHQHPEESAGAQCVECHMPSRTYMVIDDRRDHSFRIPRPDLSSEIGSPNACNTCHSDRDAKWAAREIARWPRGEAAMPEHYGRALHAGRVGAVDGLPRLLALAEDRASPAIARASALSLLSRYPGAALPEAIRSAAADEEPLVRLAAVRAADSTSIDLRIRLVGRLLRDPVRAIRIDAARVLAGADSAQLGSYLASARGPALEEYREAQRLDLDRPHAHVNLALLASSMGRFPEAEAHYRQALEIGPYFLPAYANLADLLRRAGRDAEGEALLRRALEIESDAAEIHHALGLLLVRMRRASEAVDSLARASELAPDLARYAYVYGVALYSGGEVERALEVLRVAHERHPVDLDVLQGLASISREAGRVEESLGYVEKLEALTRPGVGAMERDDRETTTAP